VAPPVTGTALLRALDRIAAAAETVDLSASVVTPPGTPLGGSIQFTLHGDGSYKIDGHVRATGWTSYKYRLAAIVRSQSGNVVIAQKTGEVHGTDTPGDREDKWQESDASIYVQAYWPELRSGATLGYHLDYDLAGTTGVVLEALRFLADYLVAGQLLGPAGAIFMVGHELSGDLGLRLGTPGVAAGIAVASGTVLVFGPGVMLPAVVAGVVAGNVVDADIHARSMTDAERQMADRVFGGSIPYDRIILTNLTRDGNRKFTIPSFDNSILVNLGEAMEVPGGPSAFADPAMNTRYPNPGQVFIHELTHAWQIALNSFLPGLICSAAFGDRTYDYFDPNRGRLVDTAWTSRSWSAFTPEQQAQIVDDWYGAYYADLNSPAALSDPAYRFIQNQIRARRN